MTLFFAVGVLFGMGYGAGFGVRALTAHLREHQSGYRPLSSLREYDIREDAAWTR